MKLFHVPIPLHLRLVSVGTPIHLASEGKEVLVNDLGSQAMAGVLLGSLDVTVHHVLCLELLSTTFVGAGKWALASVIHSVQLEPMWHGVGH